MPLLPPDHPERRGLAAEVHARPPEALQSPARVIHLAVMVDGDARAREREHVVGLCRTAGVAVPPDGANHFSVRLGEAYSGARLRWERHSEFSSYTVFMPAGSDDAAEPIHPLPEDWFTAIPGQLIFAARALLVDERGGGSQREWLAEAFGGHQIVGAEIGEGAGLAYTDFRIHADGYARFLVVNRSLTPRQAGRTLQRLFEIEVYRMMALLALPIARREAQRLAAIESALTALTDDIAGGGLSMSSDEMLLQQLTRLAAEVERGLAASQFRFSAGRAYAELVDTRIAELRERRLIGIQTIEEFMARRFRPAVATCNSVSQRLHDLSERVAQASALLSTRVDIARERQNQALLASMNRRARLQLRLQQTVEGLSVAAIVYYVAGLIGYVAKGLKAGGLHIDPDLVIGLAIPVVAVVVMVTLKRVHDRIAEAGGDL